MQPSGKQNVKEKSLDISSIPAVLIKKFSKFANKKKREDINTLAQTAETLNNSYIDTQPIKELVGLVEGVFGESEAFKNINHLIDEVKTSSELNHVLLVLTDLLYNNSNRYVLEKKEKIFQIPIAILNYFNFEKEYMEESEGLKKYFESIKNSEELKNAIQSALELIKRVYADSRAQQKELEKFIYNVGMQISQIGDEMHSTVEKQVSDLKQQSVLNLQMKNAVGDLNNNILQENNIDSLKDTIKVQLDSLQKLVEEEQQVIKLQERHIKESVESLVSKVDLLTSETEELKKRVKKEKENALRDALTGLHNREAYKNKITALLTEFDNNQNSLSILVWDIDNFKQFNDTYGHVVGDKVLKTVSSKLNLALKGGYFLARYGGEEFVMLLPNVKSDAACKFANSIREDISRVTFLLKAKKIKITISCGIATYNGKESAEKLFSRADKALYKAKMNGRNCVEVTEEDD